jgi:hypothetical protein
MGNLTTLIRGTAEALSIVDANQSLSAEDQAIIATGVDSALLNLSSTGYIWWVDNNAIPDQAMPVLERIVAGYVASKFYAGSVEMIGAFKGDGVTAVGDLEFMRPDGIIVNPPLALS